MVVITQRSVKIVVFSFYYVGLMLPPKGESPKSLL